jgi:hypothetical protein
VERRILNRSLDSTGSFRSGEGALAGDMTIEVRSLLNFLETELS